MAYKSLKDFAIGFETKGVNLYLSLASKTTNILGKRLFYSLAEQEVQHAAMFDISGYDFVNRQKTVPVINDIESVLKEFWLNAEKEEIKNEDSHFSGYELAMDMEKQSISAYQEFLLKTDDENEKEFLKWIIDEEKKHLEALHNVHYYLTETTDWFQKEESKVWNWMNQ